MDLNCKSVIERYFLNNNPLYAFSLPLSILIAIIVFGYAKAYNWSDNSYINQILIPILALVLSLVVIDIIARLMLPKKEMSELVNKCKLWTSNQIIKENFTPKRIPQSEEFEKSKDFFLPNINNLVSDSPEKKSNETVETPIETIGNLSPFPLESKKYDSKCIEDSNCCSLCSGTDSNPCNIVAPIPGPNWLPQSAESVQNRLVNNDYTSSKCPL